MGCDCCCSLHHPASFTSVRFSPSRSVVYSAISKALSVAAVQGVYPNVYLHPSGRRLENTDYLNTNCEQRWKDLPSSGRGSPAQAYLFGQGCFGVLLK